MLKFKQDQGLKTYSLLIFLDIDIHKYQLQQPECAEPASYASQGCKVYDIATREITLYVRKTSTLQNQYQCC
ncbi:hypothetical protein VN97_g8692 [Penicillium thymicola]|uniref:Uncharacterized protein n=1 Tax=Penicillium thymicola TaxID=293382 RepID=A0AAI9TD06_PENTH|nr:hypothetical protein VN97_g8692 [Penicillium thymicola]